MVPGASIAESDNFYNNAVVNRQVQGVVRMRTNIYGVQKIYGSSSEKYKI